MLNAKIVCSGAQLGVLAVLLAGCSAMSGSKPTLKLGATSWTVTGISDGRGGVRQLIAGSRATLNFGTDGTLSGSASCNNYTGRYEVTGSQLKFPNAFASTRKICVNPGVMDQEQTFFKSLAASTTGYVDGKKLELRDSSGTLQISAAGN